MTLEAAVLKDDAVLAVLIGCLKQHIASFGNAVALDPVLNARMAIWPLFVTGVSNIRDVIPFARTPGSAEF